MTNTTDGKRGTEKILGEGELAVTELHLVVIDGAAAGTQLPCGAQSVTIGAAATCDLRLPDPAVSAQHARLERTAEGLVLRDLGSTNGIWLAETRVREIFVRPGLTFRVGRTTLAVDVRARRDPIRPSTSTRFGQLVGRSKRMRQLFALLEHMAPTEVSILITGPSGTGKELVARAVHEASPRAKKGLHVLDCGAIERSLVASELFGHEAGAFTGALGRRAGVFEAAQGGTVFLDEVGELPLDLQPRLLRVLDQREIRRSGGNDTVPVDVRVVAATNRSLPDMVSKGTFREDLYYRLCQLQIELPGLDERSEDVPLLVTELLARLAPRADGPRRMAPDALAVLWSASYPGNVRQLRNIVERAAMMAPGALIERAHLMLDTPGLTSGSIPRSEVAGDREEKQKILDALAKHDKVLWKAAQELGIALNTLKKRMARLGVANPSNYPRRKP